MSNTKRIFTDIPLDSTYKELRDMITTDHIANPNGVSDTLSGYIRDEIVIPAIALRKICKRTGKEPTLKQLISFFDTTTIQQALLTHIELSEEPTPEHG